MRPISLNCWSGQRTHQIPEDEIMVSARAFGAPPPPAPPAPAQERGEDIVVTGSRIMAEREELGDLKLYRIPIPVSVASRSQKQVALLEQPTARLARLAVWKRSIEAGAEESELAEQVLLFENREKDGLGIPLPAGSFTLFATRGGQPFLLGEGRMTDRAVGEKVEVGLDSPSSVRVVQRELSREGDVRRFEIVATNDSPEPQRFEARLDGDGKVDAANGKIVRIDGRWVWAIVIPANASRTLRFRYR
jgi:hypothetical protein